MESKSFQKCLIFYFSSFWLFFFNLVSVMSLHNHPSPPNVPPPTPSPLSSFLLIFTARRRNNLNLTTSCFASCHLRLFKVSDCTSAGTYLTRDLVPPEELLFHSLQLTRATETELVSLSGNNFIKLLCCCCLLKIT